MCRIQMERVTAEANFPELTFVPYALQTMPLILTVTLIPSTTMSKQRNVGFLG